MGDMVIRRALAISSILSLALIGYGALQSVKYHVSSGSIMRVGIIYPHSAADLDPASISTAFEYDILQNIYGRLLRYDNKNQLVADVPESFSWSENEIRFVFGKKAQTISGHVIDALDAEASLKRLVVQGRSGHGDVRRFLCPEFKLTSLRDICPGIRVEGDTLILRVINPEFLSMLIGTLESADYSIVPRSSVDEDTGGLKDRTHRNTSGPYFVEKDSKKGYITLVANPRHYLFHKDMPQRIEIIPEADGGVLQGFIDGKIDFLPTSAYFTGPLGKALVESKENDVNETLPISVTFIQFSKRGLEEFTVDQRMYAGLIAGESFVKLFGSIGGRPTEQFFQTFSDGTLSEEEIRVIRSQRERVLKSPPSFSRSITYGVPEAKYAEASSALKSFPFIKVVSTGLHPINLKADERPDMYYSMTDSAWAENISLIGYNFESGVFHLPNVQGEKWLQDYISIRSKEERMNVLRALHLEVLQNASIVPVEVAPYFSVVRGGWKLNQSKIMIGTELWAIRRN